MGKSGSDLKIRRVKKSDAARVAELSGQLGYPATKKQIVARLKEVLRRKDGACFVAECPELGVMGWVHVSANSLVEVGRRAEVNGLIVDEAGRNLGVGKFLLDAAEKWAKGMKCKSMSVRSNVLRERAHGFYERNGYEHYKTQKAFRKKI